MGEDFPVFIIIDDKGNDFFKRFSIEQVDMHSFSVYNEFPEIFAMIDTSKDSRIQTVELVQVLEYPFEEAQGLVNKYDTARIGALDIDQFLLAYASEPDLRARVAAMYQRYTSGLDDDDED